MSTKNYIAVFKIDDGMSEHFWPNEKHHVVLQKKQDARQPG